MRKTQVSETKNERVKLLVIIVPRSEADIYREYLKSAEVAIQLVFAGHGTASKEIIDLFSLEESSRKVVISAFIKESKLAGVLDYINTRFTLAPKRKGVAFVMPITAVIGQMAYKYIMNIDPQGGTRNE